MDEVVDVSRRYAHRVDKSKIPAVAAWTEEINATLEANEAKGGQVANANKRENA